MVRVWTTLDLPSHIVLFTSLDDGGSTQLPVLLPLQWMEESPSELGHLMRGKLLAQSLGLGDSSLRTRAPEPSNFGDRPYVWEYLPSFHTFIICCAAQLMR